MRRHAAQLFFLDKNKYGPDFKELGIDSLDTTPNKKIDDLKDGGKVFVVFNFFQRISASVEVKRVIPIIEKFGPENVILLGLSPNNGCGAPNEYELPKTNYKLRCLKLGWDSINDSPTFGQFSKFQKENEEAIKNIKEICGVTVQQTENVPNAADANANANPNQEGSNQNNDLKPTNKPNSLFKFICSYKATVMLACATGIAVVVLCKKPEILTNFKDLISNLCSRISEMLTGR